MHARNTTLVLSLLAFAVPPHAMQSSPTGGALATPGNRIVGLWSTQGTVSGCSTGVPVIQVRNNLLFQAGGTVIENIAPTTARNGGMGVWSYDPTTRFQGTRPVPPSLGGGIETVMGVVIRTYDGAGSFTQVDNVKGSVTGIVPDRGGFGTYSVNPDCSAVTSSNRGPAF